MARKPTKADMAETIRRLTEENAKLAGEAQKREEAEKKIKELENEIRGLNTTISINTAHRTELEGQIKILEKLIHEIISKIPKTNANSEG